MGFIYLYVTVNLVLIAMHIVGSKYLLMELIGVGPWVIVDVTVVIPLVLGASSFVFCLLLFSQHYWTNERQECPSFQAFYTSSIRINTKKIIPGKFLLKSPILRLYLVVMFLSSAFTALFLLILVTALVPNHLRIFLIISKFNMSLS